MKAMPPSPANIQAQLTAQLSLPSRLGYTLLLLASLTMAGAIANLLLTEVGLPQRTIVAFAIMLVFSLAWVLFAGWVLLRRKVLYLRHRIVASRLAVTFSAVLVLGSIAISQGDAPARAWIGAGATGALMLVIALVMLRNAHTRVNALEARRALLQSKRAQ